MCVPVCVCHLLPCPVTLEVCAMPTKEEREKKKKKTRLENHFLPQNYSKSIYFDLLFLPFVNSLTVKWFNLCLPFIINSIFGLTFLLCALSRYASRKFLLALPPFFFSIPSILLFVVPLISKAGFIAV